MVLESLTPAEQARHERAVQKIRGRLFRRYSPVDYFIVQGSEQILKPSAESCWNAACGNYRVFRFGGLKYKIDCCDLAGPGAFSVSHFDRDVFTFWLSAAQGHTLSCLAVRFRDLDEIAHSYVCSARRANIAPIYRG